MSWIEWLASNWLTIAKNDGISLVWSVCKRLWLPASWHTLSRLSACMLWRSKLYIGEAFVSRHSALNSTTHKKVKPSELRSESFPNQIFRWYCSPGQHLDYSLIKNHKAEDSLSCASISEPQTLSENKCVVLQATKFWTIYYAA